MNIDRKRWSLFAIATMETVALLVAHSVAEARSTITDLVPPLSPDIATWVARFSRTQTPQPTATLFGGDRVNTGNDRSLEQCEYKMKGVGPFSLYATGYAVNGYYGEPKPGDFGFVRRVVLQGGYGVGSPDKYAFIDGFDTAEASNGTHVYFCRGKMPTPRAGYSGYKMSTPPAPGSP